MRSPGAEELIAHHRMKGDFTLIISATNLFIISPIAKLLNVDDCLGTILEKEGDQFTGKIIGEPCFQDGKLLHLNTWLSQHPELSLTDSYFYSDSINDLPMLEYVDHPRAVNADQQLLEIAKQREWPIYNFY